MVNTSSVLPASRQLTTYAEHKSMVPIEVRHTMDPQQLDDQTVIRPISAGYELDVFAQDATYCLLDNLSCLCCDKPPCKIVIRLHEEMELYLQ